MLAREGIRGRARLATIVLAAVIVVLLALIVVHSALEPAHVSVWLSRRD